MEDNKLTKPFEVLRIEYRFVKSTRKIWNEPKWRHWKSYKTIEAVKDALWALRRSNYDKWYYHYPDEESESKYPHLMPTINIFRYKGNKK